MNQLATNSAIPTGDFVGSSWGASPFWTPYAEAIADHYPIQVPLYLTTSVDLVKSPGEIPFVTVVTRPNQYDVLIIGASAWFISVTVATENWTYVNITHEESGIPWATPTRIGYIPLAALAGIGLRGFNFPMPIVRLPEAFFLPAHSKLKLDWTVLNANLVGPPVVITVKLTFVGVQLINNTPGFKAPSRVVMPNGEIIAVGSRLPWFATMPVGEYQSRRIDDFQIDGANQVTQFTMSDDCDVEIHDAFSNASTDVTKRLLAKISDTGEQTFWTPALTASQAIFGNQGDANPGRPFTKPYLLKSRHRLQTILQNAFFDIPLDSSVITYRGVRLCEY